MPTIVILGSLTLGDYEIYYPIREPDYTVNHKKAFKRVFNQIMSKIDKANCIICFFSDSDVGEHTKELVKYARSKHKNIQFIYLEKNQSKSFEQ